MKLNSVALLLAGCLCLSGTLLAQNPRLKDQTEKGYYIFPVQPGKQNFLSGTMGELRPGHFHGGLDIKTGSVTGWPIHAAAEGYVNRIKVSTSGYGNVMYIAHPNGTTTVYAHLEGFEKGIAKWVREQQYNNKTFEIELFPERNQFFYKQSDVIGYGGNSGGSGGPHLHFEIRDARQDVINPLDYGFDEITDNIPPYVYKLALTTQNKESRVGHEFGRFEYRPVLQNKDYKLTGGPIPVWGTIGVELLAYDKFNGADNINGFPAVEMLVNGKEVYAHNVNRFAFDLTRHIEVHTHYGVRKKTGSKFMRLYVTDGNELPLYKTDQNSGNLIINQPDSVYDVLLKLTDSYGNIREVQFQLKGEAPKQTLTQLDNKVGTNPDLYENLLLFSAPAPKEDTIPAVMYSNRRQFELSPAYSTAAAAMYLWDMRQGLPDSFMVNNTKKEFGYKAMVPSKTVFNLYLPELDLSFPKNSLFDTLYLQTGYQKTANAEIFTISEDVHPLFSHITATLKTQQEYPQKDKTHVYEVRGKNSWSWAGGEWQGNNITFRTRTLGQYTLRTDVTPPVIRPVRANTSSLAFQISDGLSGIKSFDVYVDGEWVLMNYDYKRALIWSEKLDENKPFKGPVEVRVKDNAGNEHVYTTKI
ncbi:peptidase m23 [Flammeovirgaceae bacterium 311]|nr:peptidase m23 [Flammeovirgaceae bacterium 311]